MCIMDMKTLSGEQLVKLILGGDENNVKGVIVNDDLITYTSEMEEGYDDHDEPIITFYSSEDDGDLYFGCSINDLNNAKIDGSYILVNNSIYGKATILPLVAIKQ